MSDPLRHIALTVEQAGTRSYAWLLIESAGGRVFVLKKAAHSSSTYLAALNQGYEELVLLSACGLHGRSERGLDHRGGRSAANEHVLEFAGVSHAV